MQEFNQMITYIKKSEVILLCLALALSLTACKTPKKGDYPAPLMIDGTNYYTNDNPDSVEVDKDLMNYTTSYAEDGIPQKDRDKNVNRKAGTPYAVLEHGLIVVFINNQWIEFKSK